MRPREDEAAQDEEERNAGRSGDEQMRQRRQGRTEVEGDLEVEAEDDEGCGEAQAGEGIKPRTRRSWPPGFHPR
jgi:hypothetical protein